MCECLAAFFQCLWLATWPIVSIVFGLVFGSIVGAVVTAVVFVLTLVRTPMHVYKMLRVTATTDECFRGHLGPIMRILVFILVPALHILFLVGVTVFALTIGMLFYVGKTTKVFYNHEYKKTMKQAESNARLEPKSHLGKYVKSCQEFMEDDTKSYPAIYFLKGCCAAVCGFLLGSLPFIPLTVAVVGITLLRVPVNMYKTMKIALFTVLLKWDLRILALITLPVVHILFPIAVFIVSIVVSYGHFALQTTENIFEGKSPFENWDFCKKVDEYHKMHLRFVGETCSEYDHPTGIPNGWQGDSYGIPVRRILRWQRDFLLCCIFAVWGVLVCLPGTILLAVVKILPSFLYLWNETIKEYLEQTAVKMMGTWPFYLACMCLVPVLVLIFYAGLVVASIFMACFRVPWTYIESGYLAAFREPLLVFKDVESASSWCSFDWELSECFPGENPHAGSRSAQTNQSETTGEARQRAGLYWDRFISQSIESTSELIRLNWITLDDVQSADPSVIQSIPAVAVLKILADSSNEEGLQKEDIKWEIDGTVCRQQDRPKNDGVVAHLWPMVFEVKKMLLANTCELAKKENIKQLVAIVCSNSEEDTEDLRKFLNERGGEKDRNYTGNNRIRTKLNELVLCMSRTKPYQDRMGSIFSFDYEAKCEEGGVKKDEDDRPAGMNGKAVTEESTVADNTAAFDNRELSGSFDCSKPAGDLEAASADEEEFGYDLDDN